LDNTLFIDSIPPYYLVIHGYMLLYYSIDFHIKYQKRPNKIPKKTYSF
jgi:hypothetical protein